MKDFKGTPGPWLIFPEESKTSVYCDDALGSRIADCTGQFTALKFAAREANAKAIAAVPDMIEALEGLIIHCDVLGLPMHAFAIVTAQAALSKALD